MNIIGTIIGNLITIAIIGIALYSFYKKNISKISAIKEQIENKINNIQNMIEDLNKATDNISELISQKESNNE